MAARGGRHVFLTPRAEGSDGRPANILFTVLFSAVRTP